MTSTSLDTSLHDQSGLLLETRSGMRLRLRAAEPKDAGLVADLLGRLSPESLRFRFLDSSRPIEPRQIAAMVGIDERHSQHVLAFDEATNRPVASLVLAADESLDTAEVAIAVADDVRGKGIGYALLGHAVDLARERGVKRIVSLESRAHHDAIEVERAFGFKPVIGSDDAGCVVLEARLA